MKSPVKFPVAAVGLLLSLSPALGGCNVVTGLQIIDYVMLDPFFPEEPIEARYTLPAGTVVVRVRSQGEIETTMPALPDMIARRTIKEMHRNILDCEFVPASRVNDIRRRKPTRFATMQARELGREVSADTLVDVQVSDFRRSSPEEGDQRLAYLELLVRVIDCRTETVLWPEDADYEIVRVKAGKFQPSQDREEFNRTLDHIVERASDQTAKLFYRWRPPKENFGETKD
jgi:hypothetical protein